MFNKTISNFSKMAHQTICTEPVIPGSILKVNCQSTNNRCQRFNLSNTKAGNWTQYQASLTCLPPFLYTHVSLTPTSIFENFVNMAYT